MTASIQEVANKTFDYIVIGGGTAGLTLASRLSADVKTTVLVLEAGEAHLDDPNILREKPPTLLMNDMYSYKHRWIAQKHAAGRDGIWERGKGLGGSSAVNFMGWYRPPARDYDDWEKLGNPGWNFASILPGLNKVEGFCELPPDAPARQYIDTTGWRIGRDGPIKVSYTRTLGEGEIAVMETLQNDGIPRNTMAYNGDPTGYYLRPLSRDPATSARSYATTAYYQPIADRKNLTVLVTAVVRRILLSVSNSTDEGVTARGVEFSYGGSIYVVNARKEVILSAGALSSPRILELSGIGRRDVLARIDAPVLVDLPGVGENLQEHIYVGLSYELAEGKGTFQGGSGVTVNLSLADVTSRAAELHNDIVRTLERLRIRIEEMRESNTSEGDVHVKMGLSDQYSLLAKKHSPDEGGSPGFQWIISPGHDSVPNKAVPGKSYATMRLALNHALSRGTIHCVSNDPDVPPEIDPRYLSEDIDLEMMYEQFMRMRRIALLPPFKDIFTSEVNPGPRCTTKEEIKDWIRRSFVTIYHTVGTCSMLPHEKGGVVSPELKVYGTENLRVVDISIVPLHVGANTMSTAYGIGEIAADIIEGKWFS